MVNDNWLKAGPIIPKWTQSLRPKDTATGNNPQWSIARPCLITKWIWVWLYQASLALAPDPSGRPDEEDWSRMLYSQPVYNKGFVQSAYLWLHWSETDIDILTELHRKVVIPRVVFYMIKSLTKSHTRVLLVHKYTITESNVILIAFFIINGGAVDPLWWTIEIKCEEFFKK